MALEAIHAFSVPIAAVLTLKINTPNNPTHTYEWG